MPITTSSSVDSIADAIEISASCSGGDPLSLIFCQQLLAKFGASHGQVIEAFARLSKRSEFLGKKYPFKVTNEYIKATKEIWSSPYLMMASFSGSSLFRELSCWSLDHSSKLFEKVSELCLSDFFGDATRTRNFGHPSEVGRPTEFSDAVKWIAENMRVPLGSGYRSPRRKDGGVDIFVWREFEDGFPGVPILLVQCTVSENFLNKIGDVDTRLWSSWLSSDIDPLVGLCVPQMVEKKEDWRTITSRGLLFDRNRLSSMGPAEIKLDAIQEGYFKDLLVEFKGLHL
jgi:hypothetical protein